MNSQKLNSLCEERINSLAPYIRYKSGGNEDLMQVGIVGARKYRDKQSVIDLVDSLPIESVIITSVKLGTLFPTVNNLSNFLLLRFCNSPWADVLINLWIKV